MALMLIPLSGLGRLEGRELHECESTYMTGDLGSLSSFLGCFETVGLPQNPPLRPQNVAQ